MLFVLLFVAAGAQAAFVVLPAGRITTNVAGQGESYQDVARVECDESNPTGTFTIGNWSMTLTCPDPYNNYDLVEVARTPQVVLTNVAESCLALSIGQFNNSRQAILDRLGRSVPAFRQLLQLDAVGIAALVIASEALDRVNKLTSTVNDIGNQVSALSTQYNAFVAGQTQFNTGVLSWQATQADADAKRDARLNWAQSSIVQATNDVSNLYNLTDSLSLALKLQNEQEYNNTLTLAREVLQDRQSDQAAMASSDAAVKAAIDNVYTSLAKLANATRDRIDDTLAIQNEIRNSLTTLQGTVFDYIQKKQVRRALSRGFFSIYQNLPTGYKAAVEADLIAPASANLPLLERVLYENLIINFNANAHGQVSDFNQITTMNVNFYIDADEGLIVANPALQIDQLILLAAQTNCSRPVVTNAAGSIIQEDPVFAKARNCGMWIEVTTQTCQAASNSFAWRSADGALSASQQTGLLVSSGTGTYCTGSPSVATTTVYRTLDAFRTWFASSVCDVSLYPNSFQEYQMISPLSRRIAYLPTERSNCYRPFESYETLYQSSPLAFVLNFLRTNIPIFLSNMADIDLLKNGRMPNGPEYKDVPIQYTPTQFDNSGIPIPDSGAQQQECIYAFWNELSDATLPVYSIRPIAGNVLTKTVNIQTFVAGNFTPQYTVQTSDITLNVDFNSDAEHLAPNSFIYFGDINDANFIYDVPESLTDITGGPVARERKPTYFLMQPGTTTTISLEQWRQENGPVFSALAASVSPHFWKFNKIVGADGFPYCDTNGGTPATRLTTPGATPGGQWCSTLSNFKVDQVSYLDGDGVTVRQKLRVRPRVWKLQIEVRVPSGTITTQTGAFNCTDSSLQPLGASGLNVQLDNNEASTQVVQKIVMTSSPNAPDVGSCNVVKIVTVPPQAVMNVPFPACSNASVSVFRQSVAMFAPGYSGPELYTLCRTMTAQTVIDTIATYAGIPPDINQSISQGVSSAYIASTNVAASNYQTQLAIAAASAANTQSSATFLDQIQQIRADIANTTLIVGPTWATSSADVLRIDNSLAALFAAIADKAANETAANVQFRAVFDPSVIAQNVLTALILNDTISQAVNVATQTALNAYLKNLTVPAFNFTPVSFGSFPDFSSVDNLGKSLTHGLGDLFSFPSIASLFGFIWTFIVLLLTIGFVVLLVWLAFKGLSCCATAIKEKQAEDRMAKLQETSETQMTLTKQQQKAGIYNAVSINDN